MAAGSSNPKSRTLWICLLLLSVAGAWLSGELLKRHDNVWGAAATTGLLSRICQSTARLGWSCSGALHSDWSEVRIGIPRLHRDGSVSIETSIFPVAFLGLVYFVGFAVWFAFTGHPRSLAAPWNRLPLGAALCGTVVSLMFLGVMASGRASWCIGCVAVHLINIALFLVLWFTRRGRHAGVSDTANPQLAGDSLHPSPSAQASLYPLAIVNANKAAHVAVFVLIIIVGLWAYRRAHLNFREYVHGAQPAKQLIGSLQNDRDFLRREYLAQPQNTITPRPGEPDRPGFAKLVVFTDFECPQCYCNDRSLKEQIVKAFDGRLDVWIRHYPLCADCNDGVSSKRHLKACEAAYAAEAARLQGGNRAFMQMRDVLLKHRSELGPVLYEQTADAIGLDGNAFAQKMQGDAVREVVASDIQLAQRLGVCSVPAMFLNGRRITRILQTKVLWELAAQDQLSAPANQELSAAVSDSLSAPADESSTHSHPKAG